MEKTDYKYVGKAVPRVESIEKVTGTAVYVPDMSFPGMLYAKILKSDRAHAKIKKIDISKAKKLKGVRAILTGLDLPYKLGLYMVDKPILADGKVRYFGEAVVGVAADTEDIASEAVELIKVEYEDLPAVFDPVEAFKKDAPLVHPDLHTYSCFKNAFYPCAGTNIANHFKIRKGNLDEGFRQADKIVENTFSCPQVQHVPIETHCSIARFDVPANKVEIWTSAQSPFAVRQLLSVAMGIPEKDVRVHIPYVGGGFGGKAGIHLEPLCVCLSRAAGGNRWVKITATREEEFCTLPVRQGLTAKIKTGIKKNGKITAQKIEYFWDAGAYADYGVNIGRASGYSGGGPYELENVHLDSYTLYTNHPFGTAYRGFGHVEFLWAIERQLDMAAQELNIDPVEIRRINFLRPGSKTVTGEVITEMTGSVEKCLDAALKEIGYGKKKSREEIEKEKKTGIYRSIGIACLQKAPAMPSFTASGAIIKFNEEGSINVYSCMTDYGQGTKTSVAVTAAEAMSMPLEKVHIIWENDTEVGPYDWQTVASRGTFMSCNATIKAAEDCKAQMKQVASAVLRCAIDELECKDEKIFIKHRPDEFLTYKDVAKGYMYPNGNGIGGPVIGRGSYIAQGLTTLDKETGQGRPALKWTYGAQALEIELNTNTGDIRVIKIASAFDIGQAVSLQMCLGQVIGGIVQGIGTALMEEYIYSKDGRLLNNSFTDYKIPTAKDIPEVMVPIFIGTKLPNGPWGARGVGEHPMISIQPAIAQAVYNATGVNIFRMPMTPESVYFALHKK